MRALLSAFIGICLIFGSYEGISSEEGEFSFLTYNVAGIHNLFSPLKNKKNMKAIGERLNEFDIVVLQENFSYYKLLNGPLNFAYKKKADRWGVFGNGLMRVSQTPFTEYKSFKWPKCSGVFKRLNDCLANKGFTVARHEVSPGVFIDIYNIHTDAGGHIKDKRARFSQFQFLLEKMKDYSKGNAVIIAGDWNMFHEDGDDQVTFYLFLQRAGLRYMCRTEVCEREKFGRLDRVVYRSSGALSLEVTSVFFGEDSDFYDKDGIPLSDHMPLRVNFYWQKKVN